MHAGDEVGQVVRQLGGGDKGAEELTGHNDGEDAGLHGAGLPDAVGDLLHRELLHKGIDHNRKSADGAAHSGGEPAGKSTADDDSEQAEDRDQKAQAGDFVLSRRLFAGRRGDRAGLEPADETDRNAQQDRSDQAGNHAAHQGGSHAHGNGRDQAVHNDRHGGRDQRGQRAGSGDAAHGVVPVIAGCLQLRHGQFAKDDIAGNGRTGAGAEYRIRRDNRKELAALDSAQPGFHGLEGALGDAGLPGQ